MRQVTLATAGFDRYAKTTRRAAFLLEMEQVVPWPALCALIEPYYPKLGNGRPPIGVERMLRIHFLQQWFNLSDPGVEEALYDSLAMRRFVGIDLGREPVPDETTMCRFRHLLEEHDLGRLLDEVQRHLAENGLKVATGTIVDATIISAPSSTKNAAKVEHPIGVIKRVFGFAKVRYRGLKKNLNRLLVTSALANLHTARRHLLRPA
jgi:transposase, IS5 family